MVPDSRFQKHHRCCTLTERGATTQCARNAGVKPNAEDVRTILSLTHTATCCQVHMESHTIYVQAYEKNYKRVTFNHLHQHRSSAYLQEERMGL